jgi:hypothetical protein
VPANCCGHDDLGLSPDVPHPQVVALDDSLCPRHGYTLTEHVSWD